MADGKESQSQWNDRHHISARMQICAGIISRSRHHATDNKEVKAGNKSGKCENLIYTVDIDFPLLQYVTIISKFDDFGFGKQRHGFQ